MMQGVLVALDGSDHARRALDLSMLGDARSESWLLGRRLAEQAAGTGRRFRRATGKRLLEDARARAGETGVLRVRTFLEEGDPADLILRLIERQGIDLVVMGRRGLGDLGGLLLGSVSHKVAHLADCACLTAK